MGADRCFYYQDAIRHLACALTMTQNGVSLAVGCFTIDPTIDSSPWFSSARVAIDGNHLVLYDANGQETHRLLRGQP